jgi:hypothetical protein
MQLMMNPLNLDLKREPSDMFATTPLLPLLVPATCEALNLQLEEESTDTLDSQLADSTES